MPPSVVVVDHYVLVEAVPKYVYRYRKDRLIEELTIKSLNSDDSRDRFEVNLPIKGLNEEAIRAFLSPLQILWDGAVKKDVLVFEYDAFELVFYEAKNDEKLVRCIEIEAKKYGNKEEALDIIVRVEKALGLDPEQREKKSLLQLLFPEA